MVKESKKVAVGHKRDQQKALRSLEHNLRSIISDLHDNIVAIDHDYTIVNVNDAFLRTTGYKREEVIGHHCYEILHGHPGPCENYGVDCELHEVLESGELTRCVHVHKRKDGSKFRVDLIRSPLKDENGDVRFAISAMLMAAKSTMQESEDKYRLLVETMNEGLGIWDTDDRITSVNDKLCDLWGYKRDEILELPITDFINKADFDKLKEEMLRRNPGQCEPWEIEYVRKDGRRISTITSSAPMFDTQDRYQGGFALITDITKRKQAENALEKRERDLEEKTKRLEETNTALNVLLEKRKEDKIETEEKILSSVKVLIDPYLLKLKKAL